MILRPYYLECLAHASYLIVDERTRTAVVIDPQRDIEQYLEEAEALSAKIEHVVLTHFHADFVAGHLELRDRVGAQIHLGARARAEFEFKKWAEGQDLVLGELRLRALETPGHTPEGISLLLYDAASGSSDPVAVFTGDTLFVGDVGRPDLMASVGLSAEELAGELYESLHGKLLALPDATVVYPAHGAGSMCGKNLGSERSSTIGEQRRTNPSLRPMTREEFVARVTEGQPVVPSYFGYDAQMNRSEHQTLEQSLEKGLQPLSVADVRQLQSGGAQLVDVRDADSFAAGHWAGSWNIGLGGRFATWAGTMLRREVPVVLLAEVGRENEAALRLGRIGLDRVVGYLEGGPQAANSHADLWHASQRPEPQQLISLLEAEPQLLVLDVRTPMEWEQAHIEGSLNLSVNTLAEHLDEVPQGRKICVVCKSGYRSSVAASLLRQRGHASVVDLRGGMDAWLAESLPNVGEESSCEA